MASIDPLHTVPPIDNPLSPLALTLTTRAPDPAARREQRLFEAAFAEASVGIAVTDMQRRFERANRAYCAMLGYTEAELREREVFDVTHPDDRDVNRVLIDELIAGVRSSYEFEKRYVRKDGSLVWTRVMVSLTRDENGQAEHLVALAQDVSRQRDAEQDLRVSEQQAQQQLHELQVLYTTAPVGLALLSADGYRFLRCNDFQAELMGVDASAALGQPCGTLAPGTMAALEPLFRQVLEEGRPVRNHLLTGTVASSPTVERQWRVDYVPVFDPQRKVVAIACVTVEVTEQRRAEEALRNTEKLAATGRLAATIAHEINNPLESVTNLIYLAALDPALSEETRRHLEIADQELSRVTHIAQQTLGFYRDTAGPVMVDIAQLIRDVLSLYERRMSYRRVRASYEPSPVELCCLQGEVRQVFSNLVANAIDASPQDGVIHVRARVSRDWRSGQRVLRALVADRGAGIDKPTRAGLFKPFFTTKKEVGNGLGLWVSRGMLEKQGGAIRLRTRTTTPPGTVFMITLPDAQGEDA